jgi:hypothetical protein
MPRDSNVKLDNHFEIGELDGDVEIASDEQPVNTQHNSQARTSNIHEYGYPPEAIRA